MNSLANEIENWLVRYKRTSIKPSSYDRLERSLDSLRCHRISKIQVDDLESDDIQDYINDMVRDGYALTTIKKQYHLIGAYISHANLKGEITRPIHKGVELPSESSVIKHKRAIVAYTRDEQRRLKNALYRIGGPACNAILIMLETGMRVGEVLALGWDDIDWRRKAVRVGKTVVYIGETRRSFIQNEAKSFTSNRTIPLSRNAYELLKDMFDNEVTDGGFIFHNRRGDRISYESLRWWTKKACEEAQVKYYGQHVFRHTFATNCYENGCDVKKLSQLLGHSDVTITYNIYIHLFGDALEELRAVLDD